MLSWIREKFGTVVISAIISAIALVFVFYGVLSPKATRGIHEGAIAGSVNGDAIDLKEFNRAYGRQVEYFRQMMGGQLNEDQLKAFHFRQMVFNELVQRKLRVQEADRMGLRVSDEQVRDTIREIPNFQKDGKFDLITYKQLLEANGYTPGTFESSVREDLFVQAWMNYFRDRIQVTDDEARGAFDDKNDKRKIKYALISLDAAKKALPVTDAEVKKALADPNKMNLAKSQYEARKNLDFKGKAFDDVKEKIARDLVASDKIAEAQKLMEKTASDVQAKLTGGDAQVNALLKPMGVQVKTTDWVARESGAIAGVGDVPELFKSAFAPKSSMDAASGGKAQIFPVAAGKLVALVVDTQKADPSKFESEKPQLLQQIASRKMQELSQASLAEAQKKAKIERNPDIVNDDRGGGDEG